MVATGWIILSFWPSILMGLLWGAGLHGKASLRKRNETNETEKRNTRQATETGAAETAKLWNPVIQGRTGTAGQVLQGVWPYTLGGYSSFYRYYYQGLRRKGGYYG